MSERLTGLFSIDATDGQDRLSLGKRFLVDVTFNQAEAILRNCFWDSRLDTSTTCVVSYVEIDADDLQEALDESVTDCAVSEVLHNVNQVEEAHAQEMLIVEAERKAASINSSGIKAQAEYLVQRVGHDALAGMVGEV